MSGSTTCPACGGDLLRHLITTAPLPVTSNVQLPSPVLARAVPRAALDLVGCELCGLVFNRSFRPHRLDYGSDYETSLHHSARFVDYAAALVDELARDLPAGAEVIEIGCGRGEFIAMFAALGLRSSGFDRSCGAPVGLASGLRLHARDFDPERDLDRGDLVICRHVLEHVADPLPLLEVLRRASKGRVYLEVPNGMWTLKDGGVWDLIYEHCSYFTEQALAAVLRRAALGIHRISTAYGNQFLQAFCRVLGSAPSTATAPFDQTLLPRFAQRVTAALAHWSARMRDEAERGHRVVAWGAGSKAVTFLNAVAGAEHIAAVVDLNPRKHGRHLAGSGHRIVAPDTLVELAPDLVLVMNPLYRDEIAARLQVLGLGRCAVECVT